MEQAAIAFGRYLRSLRERRGLSLPQAALLSTSSVKPLDKGTLSRLEHGRQRPAVSALIPICHIYQISADALVERLELDTELDRAVAPSTEGIAVRDLLRLGRIALTQTGRKWDAYAYFREAACLAANPSDPLGARTEQERFAASLNLATVIRSLGKNRLALHELIEIERARAGSSAERAIVLDRLSNCYRCLAELGAAARYAERAIEAARSAGEPRVLAFAEFSRSSVAFDRGDVECGIAELGQAFRTYRDAGEGGGTLSWSPSFEVDALLRLSEAYLMNGAHEKAGRAALAARKLASRHDLPSGLAYSELFLGQLDVHAGRRDDAVRRWRRAAAGAVELHNQRLAFAAEFFVYRSALDSGYAALARAAQRRLERLAPWVPMHLPLLAQFRETAEAH
jgi:transcriptional regulator with XRE-family HTH domain